MAKPVKVEIVGDSSNYKKAIKEADAATKAFADKTAQNSKDIKVAAGVAAVAIGAFAADAVSAASDYNETVSKSKVIFGAASDTVIAFAEDAASSLGLSQQSALDAEATFATFGKGAGLAGEDLGKFAQDLTGLAADMASFSNTSPEQAIEAIGAALRGEAEPIRAYGVLLDDATLKAAAMKLGIYDGTGALTQQQKVLAAQAAIFEQTTDAQGDFARTSDGLAGQTKTLTAEFENMKVMLGAGLIPVVSKLLGFVSEVAVGADASAESFDAMTAAMDTGEVYKVVNAFQDLIKETGDARSKFDQTKHAAGAFFDQLGGDNTEAVRNFDKAFGDLAKNSPEAAAAVVQSMREVVQAAEDGNDTSQQFVEKYDLSIAKIEEMAKALPPTAAALTETERETRRLSTGTSALGDALGETEGAVEEVTATVDAFHQSLIDVEFAYDKLTGKLDEQDAWAHVQESIMAFAANTDKTAQDVRDLTRDLADYINETTLIPAEKKTMYLALLDEGKLEEVEERLAILARNREATIDIVTKGGAGYAGLSGARAAGGPVSAGGSYLVGEKGPEVLQMGSQSGNVTPNGALGGVVVQSVTINMPVGSSGDDVVRAIKQFERRNGPGWRS